MSTKQKTLLSGNEHKDIRWIQRFENFSKSFALFSEINQYHDSLSKLEREGFIQRFEVVFELAWKTVKDYLEYLGHQLSPSPRNVIKEAFAANIIEDGQAFIDMLDARNIIAQPYDEEAFDKIFLRIKLEFFPAIEKLYTFLRSQLP